MPLECLIHQLDASAPTDGCLDDGEWQSRHTETSAFGYVGWSKVAAPQTQPGTTRVIADARHGDLDDLRREIRDAVPPRGGEPAGCGVSAVTPDGGADPGRVGERSIIDEVDAASTSSPMSGPDASLHGVLAEPDSASLQERDDAVVAAK